MRGSFNDSRLFPASPEALRDLHVTHAYDWEKPWGVRAFLARVIGFGLILSEADPHRKQRRVLTPAFNIRNIRALYGLMWNKTNVLLTQLQKEMDSQGFIDICPWASRLTLDIIGPSALSREFGTLTMTENPIADAFAEILEPSRELVVFFAINFFFPQWICTRLPLRANETINRNCSFLRNTCATILAEKHATFLGSGSDKKPAREEDILANIIESGEFSDDEIVDQMLTFLAAGHETTASALSWTMYLLSTHPEIQERLRDEVRTVIPEANTPVTHTMLEGMPVLNGVCEETLRLFPTVPTTIRESVRDTTMAGVPVPKGTLCIVVPYAINRHPLNWGANATEFVPDRWIDTTPDGTQRPNKNGGSRSNFCEETFLHGPRSCIGRDFAKAELRCAVAGIVGRFAIEMVDPNQEIIVAGTVTTKPVGGMKLKLRPVEGW